MPDYYAMGLEEEIGIFSPANVLDEMNLIKDTVDMLDAVIQPSDKARPEFKSNWTTFRDTWRKFYESHTGGPLAWMSRAFNETMDQVQDYKRRVASWQDAAAREGLVIGTPSPMVEREDKVKTYIFYGGVLIVGGFVVYGIAKYALGRLFSIGED